MINLKSFSVVDKQQVKGNIHIVGVGALGSMIAISLVRLNLASKIVVHDMDIVEEGNLNNQAYLYEHIGKSKVEALIDLASKIDVENKVRGRIHEVSTLPLKSSDILILAVDNFATRISLLKSIRSSPLVVSGGISSIGGNVEVTRGDYEVLIKDYEKAETNSNGEEYSEDDLSVKLGEINKSDNQVSDDVEKERPDECDEGFIYHTELKECFKVGGVIDSDIDKVEIDPVVQECDDNGGIYNAQIEKCFID